ncbi:MAG: hypothetical protein AMJ65_12345 [Phycisphaerae bacterium SG8_4]|nr:MAG: hypothetical protein AMJ65_12345 [Phycisphaerae bacterium SG8_4]
MVPLSIFSCYRGEIEKKRFHNQYALRTYAIAGGLMAVNPTNCGWEIMPCVKYCYIKNPATKYVFLAECDPRGFIPFRVVDSREQNHNLAL